MEKGFWQNRERPIIGLAPMDGITDAPFRFISAKYGHPFLHITEFTSAEGICAGAVKTLRAFLYDENERPVIAQVFGSSPESYYKTAFVIAELGFDGLDINMGCPAKNITSKGSGAGLIINPALAKQLMKVTKKALQEWSEGKKIEEIGLPEKIIQHVKQNRPKSLRRKILPLSIKTRIGYDDIVIEEWVKHLLELEPANITIHGRTLKQMYSGEANWEAIGRAARIIHQTETLVLGNGDIKNLAQAYEKIKNYGVDGALIGRAALGNPWIFQSKEPLLHEKLNVAIEHAEIYEKRISAEQFMPMRKHLAWYCRGFPNASEIRQKLMQSKNSKEVQSTLKDFGI